MVDGDAAGGHHRDDGAISADGLVMGTYCHGLLQSAEMRSALLAKMGASSNELDHGATVDGALDELAANLEAHLDIATIIAIAGGEI